MTEADEFARRLEKCAAMHEPVTLFGVDYAPETTCHTVEMDCFGNPPYNQSGFNGSSMACGCSECGAPWSTCGLFRGNALHHNFKACPICGRKVVNE